MEPWSPPRGRPTRWLLTATALAVAGLSAAEAAAEPSKLAPEAGFQGGEIETGRTGALGGATRAIGADLSGHFANPANVAASRVYHLGALAIIAPEARRQSYGAAMADSVTNSRGLAAAVSGVYTVQDNGGLSRKATDARFTLAFPMSERLFVGATGKYLKLRQDGLGPLGQSYASGGRKNEAIVNGFTFDAGFAARPVDLLRIAVVGTNLTATGDGYRPLGVGGGVGIGTRTFNLEADVAADFTTYDRTTLRYMGGAELLAADAFALRGGYRFDQGDRSHAASFGFGYVDPAFSFELSVRRTLNPYTSTMLFLGVTYFLESTGLTRTPNEIPVGSD